MRWRGGEVGRLKGDEVERWKCCQTWRPNAATISRVLSTATVVGGTSWGGLVLLLLLVLVVVVVVLVVVLLVFVVVVKLLCCYIEVYHL